MSNPKFYEPDGGDLFVSIPADAQWATMIMQTGLYGYVLFVAANMIGDGADLLLLIPSYAPLVGTIVIPILGAVPDGMLVLFSGLGDSEHAQQNVGVGVGALAGSTIMLLTLPWFLAILGGRVSIVQNRLTYKAPENEEEKEDWKKLQKGNAGPCTSGVAVTRRVRQSAVLMLLTATTYFWVQGPAFAYDHSKYATQTEIDNEHPFAWIGFIVSLLWFVIYIWMMSKKSDQSAELGDKLIQKQVAAIQRGEITIQGVMAECNKELWTGIIETGSIDSEHILDGGKMQTEILQMWELLAFFFNRYDTTGDGFIGFDEFRCVMKELNVLMSLEAQKILFTKIAAINGDNSKGLNFPLFISFIINLALRPERMLNRGGAPATAIKNPNALLKKHDEDEEADEEEAEDEDMPHDLANLSPEEQQWVLKKRAFTKLFVGTLVVVIFSDPMCDNLGTIGKMAHVKPFFVSFVLAPLASNASELVAAMRLASKKTISSMENSLNSLLGAACMNNTFCLSIFMFLIIYQRLAWKFAAETLSILLVEVLVALVVLSGEQHKFSSGILILACYPMSLVFVKLLEAHGLD